LELEDVRASQVISSRPAFLAALNQIVCAPDGAVDFDLGEAAERDAGRRADGPPSAEREELACLRRENQRLRQERDILAKAAAWFARESKASPSGFSGS
jgi:transposase